MTSRGAGRGGHCPRGFEHRDPPPPAPITLPAPAQTPHKCHQRTSCFRLKRNAEYKRQVCQTRAGGSRDGVLKAQQGSSNSISNSKSSYTSHFVRAGSLSSEPRARMPEIGDFALWPQTLLRSPAQNTGAPGREAGVCTCGGLRLPPSWRELRRPAPFQTQEQVAVLRVSVPGEMARKGTNRDLPRPRGLCRTRARSQRPSPSNAFIHPDA